MGGDAYHDSRTVDAPRVPRSVPVRAASALLAALLLAAAAPEALSQEAPSADLPPSIGRLRVEKRILYDEKALQREATADRFVVRLEGFQGPYAEKRPDQVEPLEVLLGDCYASRMDAFVAAGNKAGAGDMAGRIRRIASSAGTLAAHKEKADAYITKVCYEDGKEFLRQGDLDRAQANFANCLGARDKAIGKDSATQIVGIVCRRKELERIKDDDLAGLGSALQSIVAALAPVLDSTFPDVPAYVDVKDRLRDIKGKTGELEIAFFAPRFGAYEGRPAAKADLGSATFRLEPRGEGKRYPREGESAPFSDARRLWFKGTYDVFVYVKDAGALPVASYRGVVLETGEANRATLQIPAAFPPGMVYVPAGGFFIDRYEVTNAEVGALVPKEPALNDYFDKGKPADPAWFYDEKGALAIEKASGKQIPTKEQWLAAAFGGTSARWPWGDQDPTPDMAVFGPINDPKPVGGRTAGASPCGAEDMAGNMQEWIRVGNSLWFIGSGFASSAKEALSKGSFNMLRDPKPTKEGRAVLPTAEERAKYAEFVADEGHSDLGLRMVVPAK